MLNRSLSCQPSDSERLLFEAKAIIRHAEAERRDLTEFEAGRVETLLELANGRRSYPNERRSPR